MNRTLLFFSALLCLFLGGVLVWTSTQRQQPTPAGSDEEVDTSFVAPERELTEFEFTDQLAKPFNSKQLAGQIWLGTFFFADCPSICAQQNLEISKLHKRFRDRGVKIVNITVAPDDDPPHKLFTYANRYEADHETWKFLTGRDIEYVNQVGHDIFGLIAADETHTPDVAIFDREGKLHGTYNVTKGLEYAKCIKKIEELLGAESEPSASVEDESGAAATELPDSST